MQANEITLAVDLTNGGSTTNKVYTRFEETVNRSTYRGPGHTVAARVLMAFARVFPKRSGNYYGALKTSVKFTKDVAVPAADGSGNITVPMIAEVSFSVPVGVSAADTLAFRQHLLPVLDTETIAAPLMDIGDI